MKKIAFCDRDGTLVFEPADGLVREMHFIPGTISALKRLVENGYSLVMITNQDGLGTEKNPREDYDRINAQMTEVFASEGISFEKIFICSHYLGENCDCRKPKTGMVRDFLREETIDFERSFVVGDRVTDVEFAERIGVRGFLLSEKNPWSAIVAEVLDAPRIVEEKRKTKETEIALRWNLDGSGKSEISTGIGFFDHLLENFAKHGKFDLSLSCKGDLEVDEHHTTEDVALLLGSALKKALDDKRGIARYAHEIIGHSEKITPMDEAISFLALDCSGRAFFQGEMEFTREKVGDFPTEMTAHFFRSFCDSAGVNLHLRLTGKNTHHQIELAFKSFGRALAEAVQRKGSEISSTKGIL